MAYYKVFDQTKFQPPVFAFWFRRYAPFDTFGGGTGFEFEGDYREGPSTSPKATSRTYACLFFNRKEILYGFSGASGTRFVGYAAWTGGLLGIRLAMEILNSDVKGTTAHANVSLDVDEQNSPGVVAFTAKTAGSMPLLPGTPNIDTLVKARFNFNSPKILIAEGEVFGDDFPNGEVYLDSGSRHSALLVDFRTKGWQSTGPVTSLFGSHSDQSLGKFSAHLPLNDNGELAADLKQPQ